MVRKEIICFKESKELSDDNGLHCFRDESRDCHETIIKWISFVTFFGRREDVG